MGQLISVLNMMSSVLLPRNSGMPCEEVPVCHLRQEDYTILGTIREGAPQKQNHVLFSMIHLDLKSRILLWPMIESRMDRMEASLKYTKCNLEGLTERFPLWDENKIFEAHDLFQAFEVDGDGLIEIAEMSVGLDNLGDKTSKTERILQLSKGDEDGTGSIDFEEFLQILYEPTALASTFLKVNNDVKMIRWMNTVQQIQAGYL